jgi:hypothetical protein
MPKTSHDASILIDTTIFGARGGGAMNTRIWTAALVVSAVLAGFAQQPPCCFVVLNTAGQPTMIGKLGDVPYKPETEEPSVDWNLDRKEPVLDKKGQVISGFRFYGWREGSSIRVAVLARLPPEGAENRLYGWSELNKAGKKPRLEVFATYSIPAGETRPMDELKALGVEAVALRTESVLPGR